MLLSREDIGHLMVITAHRARIDAEVAATFKEQGRELLSSTEKDCLVDLSKVAFMDSSGVGALVGLLKFAGANRRLELCGLTPAVRNIMKHTRLDQVFLISASVDAALASDGLSQPKQA